MLTTRSVRIEGHQPNISNVKTPGKAILKGRGALQENANYHGPMTGNAKGKKVVLHTPAHPKTLQPQRALKDSAYGKITAVTRPLGDKTPFQNRISSFATPLPNGSKISKLSVPSLLQTPGLLRPSSARKHDRMPSATKNFQTPQTQGNHWDVSETEIECPETVAVNLSIEEEDYDEIEYMPPSAIEPPYQPPFEMPNYAEVGSAIKTLVHSYHFDDPPSFDDAIPIALEGFDHHLLLPEIEDDSPFSIIKPSSRQPAKGTGKATPTSVMASRPPRPVAATRFSRPSTTASVAAARPRTVPVNTTGKVVVKPTVTHVARRPLQPSKPASAVSQPRRPATSASTYRSITAISSATVRRPGTSLRIAPSSRLSVQAKAPTHDDMLLNFEDTITQDVLVDDFRFDI
ncbi:hypothetical protein HWV62_17424 [Athelia sp. TMB]|nr:hypothetical protein HWV62_17424 [Athelia sp. TMB]